MAEEETRTLEHLIHQVFYAPNWKQELPRLSRSDGVNLQLYALVALICRHFVQSWHSLITQDQAFVFEILKAIAAASHQIEGRLASINFYNALLDDLPYILNCHLSDLRSAKEQFAAGIVPYESVEDAFSRRSPHRALESDESEQLFLKLLSKGLVATLVDDDTAHSDCSTSFLAAVVNSIGLKNAVERLSEPWALYEIIIKVISIVKPPPQQAHEPSKAQAEPPMPFGQQIGHYYNQTVGLLGGFLSSGGRFVAYIVSLSNSKQPTDSGNPLVTRQLFPLVSSLTCLSQRAPLLASTLQMLSVPLRRGTLNQLTTQAANQFIDDNVRCEKMAIMILKNARTTLFPNNGGMGPPRVIPDAEEQERMRQQAIEAILSLVPDRLRYIVFGNSPYQAVEGIVGQLSSKKINKHLVYRMLDYCIVTIVPELAESTPSEIKLRRSKVTV
ncbi:hypothetical protein TRVA0_017S00298 [Trichomonascus vanleenenianus]|uniref:Nvj3p n=1 Tax=Trichomonascus vanleenenianus TaxID=2268995 RepID=UPI003ECA9607